MHLTRPAMLLTVLTLVVGIVGLWSESLGAVPWWRLLAGLLVIALALELVITRSRAISAGIAGDSQLYLGREQTLELELGNAGRRALAVQFAAQMPAAIESAATTQSLVLAPSATSRSQLPVRALALGRHAWTSLPMRVRGPFGLAWWTRRLPLDAELRVAPDTLGARGRTGGMVRGGSNTESALGGAMELHHLREYQPGDALNHIDWKATARTEHLVTRVFSEDQHLEVMVLLDAGRTSRTRIDAIDQFGHYVNLAARFAEYCIAGDDRVGMIAFTDRPVAALAPGRGLAAVRRVRAALTALEPAPIESDVVQAALALRRLVRHRSLVVILTDLYERSSTSQLVQASRLLLPHHLPLIVGLMSEDVIDLGQRQAEAWLDPYRSLAAREYQQHVAGSVARLVQLGAHAMSARPDELEHKVLARYDLLRAQRRI